MVMLIKKPTDQRQSEKLLEYFRQVVKLTSKKPAITR
jgi:hypothetical protein